MSSANSVSAFYRNAPHYDLEYKGLVADIPFLSQLCIDYAGKGKVLDLCCGTGRETIPLARLAAEQGFRITGVDITPGMLDRCREKLAAEPRSVQEVVELVLGDMRTVDVGKKSFNFAFVPFNSFLHILTIEDQLAALGNIRSHLVPGGHFLADIFCPDAVRLAYGLGPTWIREETVVEDEESGVLLVRNSATHYNQTTQILEVKFYYQIFELRDDRGLIKSYWSPLELRVIFPAEWRLLLTKARFEIVEEWGDYERNPFEQTKGDTSSPKMLFLCRKP